MLPGNSLILHIRLPVARAERHYQSTKQRREAAEGHGPYHGALDKVSRGRLEVSLRESYRRIPPGILDLFDNVKNTVGAIQGIQRGV